MYPDVAGYRILVYSLYISGCLEVLNVYGCSRIPDIGLLSVYIRLPRDVECIRM